MDAIGRGLEDDGPTEGATSPRIAPPSWAESALAGPAAVVAVVVGYAALWLVERPAGQPTPRFLGELSGAEALLLLSCSLVLIALVPYGERWFGGFDRVVVWHRGTAVAGVLLLVPHLALVTSSPDPNETGLGHALGDVALLGLLVLILWALAPRLRGARRPGPVRALARTTYEHWLSAHRLTGVFVAVAVAHGAIVDPVLRHSAVLRVAFALVGVAGVGAYVYRELVAPHVVPAYDYTVNAVRRLGERTAEIDLDPAGERLAFRPGQFVMVTFAGFATGQRHPFSISSGAADRELDLTVKASGDYTDRLVEALRPGDAARVLGPFGGFDYREGERRQIWIAGGIGVTPFISWIRSLDDGFDRDVDFWYSVHGPGDAVYRDEIEAAARQHPSLRTHLVLSDSAGPLTADAVLRDVAPDEHPWVYMCGPPAMMKALSRGLRRAGVPRARVRWEDFGPR
jgi:predicted ferric reductase